MEWDTKNPELQRGLLTITSTLSSTTFGPECAASGAYVVIAEKEYAGRVYQLGTFDSKEEKWALAAGADMTNDKDAPTGEVEAYVVGKGKVELDDKDEALGGSAQDTGVYVGFVQIPKAGI